MSAENSTLGPSLDASVDDASANTRWFRAALALCVVVFLATLAVLRHRDAVKNPDEAAYAEQASSLLRDGSLQVGFVRFFHQRYPADIVHPEDFYPPGNGALIAGAWSLFGRSDAASAVPSAFLACLILPLLVFRLARRFGASGAFAFVATSSALFDLAIRDHAFEAMADLPLTTAMVAALVASLRGGLGAAALGGLFVGIGFWLKPTALLFGPGFALALWFADKTELRTRLLRLAAFGGTFLLVCLPWLLRNHELFGAWLYSGNMHLTAAANDPQFKYSDIRRVYWASDAPLPGFGQSFLSHGLAPVIKRFLQHVYEIVAMHGAAAFGGVFVLVLLSIGRQRKAAAAIAWTISYLLALSAVFAVFYRYLLPVFPVVIALNWAFLDSVARRIDRSEFAAIFDRRVRSRAHVAVLLAAIVAIPGGSELARDLVGGREFIPIPDRVMHESARWAKRHLPADAVVMAQEALTFRHGSGLLTVDTPFDAPDAIEAVIRHYRIGYLVTTDSGQFAELSTQFIFPYLEKYRGTWQRIDVEQGRFTVWVREGFPAPKND
ncbi:MAG: ArnT family glycosyltransferase [Planctomycetota bacterium]